MEEQPSDPINLLPSEQPLFTEEIPPPNRRFWVYFFISLAFLLIGGFVVARHNSVARLPANPTAYDPITLKPKSIGILQTVKNFVFHSNNFLEGQRDDRINLLLLGMGGVGHDGPFLTDTNIIISLKPSERQAAIISIPRDLGVKIDNNGWQKINHLNSMGELREAGQGGEYARRIFSENFNLDIPYYIRVDFQAFTEIINALGGIEINVPKGFVDAMFPSPDKSYQTITFEAGHQIMDGERALQYARSRHGNNGEGSDFARAHRQQLVLTALKDKMLSYGSYVNPLRAQKILESLNKHISTNLEFGQIMYLTGLSKEIKISKTMVLDSQENGYLTNVVSEGGVYLLLPKDGDFNNINSAIKNIFQENAGLPPAPSVSPPPTHSIPAFPEAKIEIQNGTWRVGLASRTQRRMEERGFLIAAIGNALKRPVEKTVIYIINPNASNEIISKLSAEIKAPVARELPLWTKDDYDDPTTPENESGLKYEARTDILIVLGEDAKE